MTVNDGAREGQIGEHIVSVTSADQGKTWSDPLPLEPDRTIDNAYSTISLTPGGRIYVSYNMNLNKTHTLNGNNISRFDELGSFVMRYSDDGAKSWSADHYMIPYKETAVDRSNSFGGKTKIMWSVDQTKTRNGTVCAIFD